MKFTYFPLSGSFLFHSSNRTHGQKKFTEIQSRFIFLSKNCCCFPYYPPPLSKRIPLRTLIHTIIHSFRPLVEMEKKSQEISCNVSGAWSCGQQMVLIFQGFFFHYSPLPLPQVDPEILFSCAYLIFHWWRYKSIIELNMYPNRWH